MHTQIKLVHTKAQAATTYEHEEVGADERTFILLWIGDDTTSGIEEEAFFHYVFRVSDKMVNL